MVKWSLFRLNPNNISSLFLHINRWLHTEALTCLSAVDRSAVHLTWARALRYKGPTPLDVPPSTCCHLSSWCWTCTQTTSVTDRNFQTASVPSRPWRRITQELPRSKCSCTRCHRGRSLHLLETERYNRAHRFITSHLSKYKRVEALDRNFLLL